MIGSKFGARRTVTVARSVNKTKATAICSCRVMVFENQQSRSFRRLTERIERRVLVLRDGEYLSLGAAEKMLGAGVSVVFGAVDSRMRLVNSEMAVCVVRRVLHWFETVRELRG